MSDVANYSKQKVNREIIVLTLTVLHYNYHELVIRVVEALLSIHNILVTQVQKLIPLANRLILQLFHSNLLRYIFHAFFVAGNPHFAEATFAYFL